MNLFSWLSKSKKVFLLISSLIAAVFVLSRTATAHGDTGLSKTFEDKDDWYEYKYDKYAAIWSKVKSYQKHEELITVDPFAPKYKEYLAKCTEHSCDKKVNNMNKFNGPGKIDYEGGLLACAAIKEYSNNDNSHFKPLVLNRYAEWAEFTKYLIDNKNNFLGQTIRFIIADYHWISGAIKIEANAAKLLILDSIAYFQGYNALKYEYVDTVGLEKGFDQVDFYAPTDSRQISSAGCSIFAIEDTRKSYKCTEDELFSNELSLKFLRMTQNSQTIDNIKNKIKDTDQAKTPLNKKMQTFEESLNIVDYVSSNNSTKQRNDRVQAKLSKIKDKVWSMVQYNTTTEIQNASEQFSLRSFMSFHNNTNSSQKFMNH